MNEDMGATEGNLRAFFKLLDDKIEEAKKAAKGYYAKFAKKETVKTEEKTPVIEGKNKLPPHKGRKRDRGDRDFL
jgi:hypothetical protein